MRSKGYYIIIFKVTLTYFDFMISILIVICNHVHYKAFDHVDIVKFSKIYWLVTYLFIFVIIGWWCHIVDKLVPDFNCKQYGKIKMKKLKLFASYVRLITCLLLHRNFGNALNNFVEFTGKHLCRSHFLMKLRFLKKYLSTSGWLCLEIQNPAQNWILSKNLWKNWVVSLKTEPFTKSFLKTNLVIEVAVPATTTTFTIFWDFLMF